MWSVLTSNSASSHAPLNNTLFLFIFLSSHFFFLPFLLIPFKLPDFLFAILFFFSPSPLLIQFFVISVKPQIKDGGLPVLPPK